MFKTRSSTVSLGNELSLIGVLWGIYTLLLVGSCFSGLRFDFGGFLLHPCYLILPVIFFVYQSPIWHFLYKLRLPGIAITAFFIIMIVSSLFNNTSTEDLKAVIKWIIAFLIIIIAAATIQRREDIIFILKCSVVSLTLIYLIGIVRFRSSGDYYLNPFMGIGTKNTMANYVAAYMVVFFFFPLMFPLPTKERIFFGICLLVAVYGQVLTYSRMGLLLIVIALAAVLLYKPKLKRFLILMPFIIIFYIIFPGDRTVSLSKRYESLVTGEKTGGDELRLLYVKKATMMVTQSPLLGKGPGSFSATIGKSYVPELDFKHQLAPSHNVYFQTIAEYGFLGLIALLIFIISFFIFLLKSFLRASFENEKQLGFVLLAGVLLVIIRGNFGHEIFFMPNVNLFLGLSLSYALNAHDNRV